MRRGITFFITAAIFVGFIAALITSAMMPRESALQGTMTGIIWYSAGGLTLAIFIALVLRMRRSSMRDDLGSRSPVAVESVHS
jgi:hypothetical protein